MAVTKTVVIKKSQEQVRAIAPFLLMGWWLLAGVCFLVGIGFYGYVESFKRQSERVEWKVVGVRVEETKSRDSDGKDRVTREIIAHLEDKDGKVREVRMGRGKYQFGDRILIWQSQTDSESYMLDSEEHRWVLWGGCGAGIFAIIGGICMYRSAKRGKMEWTRTITST